MSEKIRHIRRDDWPTFHEKTYARRRIDFHGVETEAQLMHIGRAERPFTVPCNGGRLVIADSGYRWLQLAPEDGHWWMTAMYDPDDRPVQYYFDVTGGNVLTDGADAWFEDMYLDYVLHTDGTVEELDRDELEAALRTGAIAREQYDIAVQTGEKMKRMLNEAAMAEFDAIYALLRAQKAQPWEKL